MVRAAIAFFVLAIIAYLFGANEIVGVSMEIGKLLLVVFLVLSAISFLGAMISDRKTKRLP